MRIYNALKSIIQSEYNKRDYVEVMSPNMFNADLWKQSGHWNRASPRRPSLFLLPVQIDE